MAAGDILVLHRDLLHCSQATSARWERFAYLVEYVAADDVDRYRLSCPGLFDYDDRWRFMEHIESPTESLPAQ